MEEADGVGVWVDEVDGEAIGDTMVFARGFATIIPDVVDDGADVLLELTWDMVADVVTEELVVGISIVVGRDVDRLMFRLCVVFAADSVCNDFDDVCCVLGDADGNEPGVPVID